MTWQDIPGWSSDIEPYYQQLATELPIGAVFVEVGVLYGRSIACIGTLRPDLELYGVDVWQDGDRGEHEAYTRKYGTTWDAFLLGMHMHARDVMQRLHVIRAWSATVTLPMADAVFIDAGHEYEDVRSDIDHWLPRVKPGGLIAGHDYQDNYPGVIKAVGETWEGKHHMGPGEWTSVWWVRVSE